MFVSKSFVVGSSYHGGKDASFQCLTTRVSSIRYSNQDGCRGTVEMSQRADAFLYVETTSVYVETTYKNASAPGGRTWRSRQNSSQFLRTHRYPVARGLGWHS